MDKPWDMLGDLFRDTKKMRFSSASNDTAGLESDTGVKIKKRHGDNEVTNERKTRRRFFCGE